jgi:hypothetical protein
MIESVLADLSTLEQINVLASVMIESIVADLSTLEQTNVLLPRRGPSRAQEFIGFLQ